MAVKFFSAWCVKEQNKTKNIEYTNLCYGKAVLTQRGERPADVKDIQHQNKNKNNQNNVL